MKSLKKPPITNAKVGRGLSGPKAIVEPGKRIHVTEQMINEALQANSGHCMVAEAVKTALPEARHVSVDLQTIRWSDPNKRFRYMVLTPRAVQVAIINWDLGNKPLPFNFMLRSAQVAYMGGTKFDKVTDSIKEYKRKPKRSARRRITAADVAKKATLIANNRKTPTKVGGKLPPRMGLRRSFGMRAFTLGEGTADAAVK